MFSMNKIQQMLSPNCDFCLIDKKQYVHPEYRKSSDKSLTQNTSQAPVPAEFRMQAGGV